MQHTDDSRSVSSSPAKNNSPIHPRSFQQVATLAVPSPAVDILQGLSYNRIPPMPLQTTLLTPVEVAPRRPLAPLWLNVNGASERPYTPPLTGLGICIEPVDVDMGGQELSSATPVLLPLRLPTAPVQEFKLPSLRELGFEDSGLWSPSESPCVLRPYNSPIVDSPGLSIRISGHLDSPYSACPSDDFATQKTVPMDEDRTLVCSGVDVDMKDTFNSRIASLPPTPYLKQGPSPTEPLIGLFADFNMREFTLSQRSPSFGINPAFLSRSSAPSPEATMDDSQEEDMMIIEDLPPTAACPVSFELQTQDASSSSTEIIDVSFTDADVTAIVSVLSASLPTADSAAVPPAVQSTKTNSCTPVLRPYSNTQGLLVPPLPTRSGTIPSVPSPNLAKLLPMRSLTTTPRILPAPQSATSPLPSGSLSVSSPLVPQPSASARLPLGNITNTVPVNLDPNAYLGVDLEELRAKAEQFREQHPGHDIDKNWLAMYAGKLSEDGQRLDEYRCYVKGCFQTNKRRDHILVHVGSHVEFRPFQCDYWCVHLIFSDAAQVGDDDMDTALQRHEVPSQERMQAPHDQPWRAQALHLRTLCPLSREELCSSGPSQTSYEVYAWRWRGWWSPSQEDQAGEGDCGWQVVHVCLAFQFWRSFQCLMYNVRDSIRMTCL